MQDTKDLIAHLEDRRCKAVAEKDIGVLDELFGADLSHVHSSGVVHDKPGLLRHVAERKHALEIERGELAIRPMGHIAVAIGGITIRFTQADGSVLAKKGVATQVLRHEADGRWRFVSFQSTWANT